MNTRSSKILQMLEEQERLEVSFLADNLNVSPVTIRKDLIELEKQGFLKRQHGYVLRVSSDKVNYRMAFDYNVKKAIAQKAASLIQDGETIMIESGSTCALLAEELSNTKQNISIITNSIFIANYVSHKNGTRITILGGEYVPDSQVVVGPMVNICASEYYVDKFFLGTDGFVPDVGFCNVNLMRAEAVRSMAKRSANNIILSTSDKFSKRGVVTELSIQDVSMVITDKKIPDNIHTHLQTNHIEVITV